MPLKGQGHFFIFILGATARICETVNCESVQHEGRLRTDEPDSDCRGCTS